MIRSPKGEAGPLEFAPGPGASIRLISTPDRIRQVYLNLIKSATNEILIVFPTINSIHRERSIGVLDELLNAVKRNVRIRILSAEDDFIKDSLDRLRASGIVIRRIETVTETKFKMLIVDKKASYVVESKDDTKSKFTEAVGLATLSNSKATILPYVTIFESFWRETDLYERAREADKVKDEFINVAAHELRTPITPIIAGAELMRDTISSNREILDPKVYAELVDNANLIIRNAAKLSRLSEDILQVSRIEGGNLILNLTEVDVDAMILSVISDIELRYAGERPNVSIEFGRKHGSGPGAQGVETSPEVKSRILLYCDEPKISRVLYNLLDNAMKFTTSGVISITTSLSTPDNELVINVKDTGKGIDPAVKARLFEKFSAKSEGGTGLGLYLSKKIIEAHNGRIWADDRLDGPGASFSFAIPFDTGMDQLLSGPPTS